MADDEKHSDVSDDIAPQDLAESEPQDSVGPEHSNLGAEDKEKPSSPAHRLRVKLLKYKFWILGALILLLLAWGMSWRSKTPVQKAIYSIAINREWPSLNLGIKNANMTAFCELILQAIAKKEHLRLRTRYVNTFGAFPMLASKQFHGLLSNLPPDQSPNINYIYSDPLYHLGPAVIVNKNSTYTQLDEIKARAIGLMQQMSYAFIEARYPQLRFTYYDSVPEAFMDLSNRKIDALIMGALPATLHIKGLYSDFFRILPTYLDDSGIRLILIDTAENQEFIATFNKGLQAIRADGTYDRLLNEWDLINTQPAAEKAADEELENPTTKPADLEEPAAQKAA